MTDDVTAKPPAVNWIAPPVILLGTVFVAYLSALSADFVFDDVMFLNVSCWRVDNLAEVLSMPLLEGECSYRRVRFVSLAVDHAVWGPSPWGFHLTNVLLHLVCSLLLYGLLVTWFKNRWAALLAVLVWSLHPVHTDAVTYIAGRRDLLSSLFVLAAIRVWPYNRRGIQRAVGVTAAVFFFVLGFESKEMAITLPVLLVAITLFELPQPSQPASASSPWRKLRTVIWKNRLSALVMASIAVLGVVYRGFAKPLTVSGHLWGGDLIQHAQTVLAAYAKYAELALFPTTLYGDYSDFVLASGWTDSRVWFGAAIVLGLWGIALFAARRWRALAFACFWCGATLLPVSQLIPHHELMAEHYLYLPLMGFTVPICAVFSRLTSSATNGKGRVRAGLVIGVAGFLAVCTLFVFRIQSRNADFKTEVTFAEAILAEVPNSIRGRLTLVSGLQRQNRLDEATLILEALANQLPNDSRFLFTTWRNLLATYLAAGATDRAERAAETMRQLYPDDPDDPAGMRAASAYPNRVLGSIWVQRGRVDEGLSLLEAATLAAPSDLEGQLHYGIALHLTGQTNQAEAVMVYILGRAPRHSEARFWIAQIALDRGDIAAASVEFERVLASQPAHVLSLERLLMIAVQRRDQHAACRWYRRLEPVRDDLPQPSPCVGLTSTVDP